MDCPLDPRNKRNDVSAKELLSFKSVCSSSSGRLHLINGNQRRLVR
jgi:hypothetical protein